MNLEKMQLYEKRAGGSQTQKLLKGLKRAVISSVVAMKRVEPLLPAIPNKKPSPDSKPDEGYI